MKKTPTEAYVEKAKLLSKEETERLMSRMRSKLTRRLEADKFSGFVLYKMGADIEAWPDPNDVTSAGQLLAVSPGSATVRATTGGKTGSATFTVLSIPQNVY